MRRMVLREHAGVGHDDVVGAQLFRALLHKRDEAGAADLLFPFDEKGDVHGKRRARLQIGLDRFDVGEELALVIGCAAPEEFAAALDRLERRRLPQIKRFRRLHVVMPVDQHPRGVGAGGPRRARHQNRVAFGRVQFDIQPQAAKMVGKPVGTGQNVAPMLRLRRDTGETHQAFKLLDELAAMLRKIFLDHDHGNGTVADLPLQVTA